VTAPRRNQVAGVPALQFLAVIPGVAYVAYVASHLLSLAAYFDANSDVASAKLLSAEIAHGHVSGNVFDTWIPISTVVTNVAAHAVPVRDWLIQTWPAFAFALTVALACRVIYRRYDLWTAAVSGCLLISVSFTPLATVLTQYFHGPTYLSYLVVAMTLVELSAAPVKARWLVPAVVAVVGLNLASDPYLAVVVLAPLTIAAVVAYVENDTNGRAVARAVAVILGGSVATAVAVTLVVNAIGWRAAYSTKLNPTNPVTWPTRAGALLWYSIDAEVGHIWRRGPVVLAVALAVLSVGMLAATTLSVFTSRPRPLSTRLVTVFCAGSLVCIAAGFMANGGINSATYGSVHYLTTFPFACALTLPLLARSDKSRQVVGVVAAVICAASLWAVRVDASPVPLSAAAERARPALTLALQRRHLVRGYSTYASANGVTLRADGAFVVRPVDPCGATLCPHRGMHQERWYELRPSSPTFLLLYDGTAAGNQLGPAPPARFGSPLERVRIGDFSLYTYDYDIGTRFGVRA
jgi:hypothetical protein